MLIDAEHCHHLHLKDVALTWRAWGTLGSVLCAFLAVLPKLQFRLMVPLQQFPSLCRTVQQPGTLSSMPTFFSILVIVLSSIEVFIATRRMCDSISTQAPVLLLHVTIALQPSNFFQIQDVPPLRGPVLHSDVAALFPQNDRYCMVQATWNSQTQGRKQ